MQPLPRVVNADPTKDFFISMLVRDIAIVPSIIDLVDNSVDGARRVRSAAVAQTDSASHTTEEAKRRFHGLYVNITTSIDRFAIHDNCGGIPWDIASNYAFRFGRPDDAPDTPNSIGQFGIGMKRALFKMGTEFEVESTTQDENFRIDVDVDEWRRSDKWTFEHVTYHERSTPPDECGTRIQVAPLHPNVADTFSETTFENQLRRELSRKHQTSMSEGLVITLNGLPINTDIQTLFNNSEINPALRRITLGEDQPPEKQVHVVLLAGVEKSSPSAAGWYVYCNGRLVLGPDQTNTTGWGEGKGKAIPQYHNQFARFRGHVLFESAAVENLPWTTTKEGIDRDHPTYRAIRPAMITAMRPVIDFLNALDREQENGRQDVDGSEFVSLEESIRRAEHTGGTPIMDISATTSEDLMFSAPVGKKLPPAPKSRSIQYRRPIDEIERAMAILKVSSLREVGEQTFDYYLRREDQ